jgi:hypothetical protein
VRIRTADLLDVATVVGVASGPRAQIQVDDRRVLDPRKVSAMPIDFQERRISFAADNGGPRTQEVRFEFPSRVNRAHALVNGFNIGFVNSEHPLRSVEVNTRTRIDEEDVDVVATFALRDNSGNFDDRYSGFVDVVVLVDRA